MEKIKIIIKADGTLEYTVQGVKGKTCKEMTKLIDQLGNVAETKNTAEYYQAEDVRQKNQVKQ